MASKTPAKPLPRKPGPARKTTARKTAPARKTGGARGNGAGQNGAGQNGTGRLAQEIVIESVIESAATEAPIGAQAIAPDHVPRSAPSLHAVAAQIARPASLPGNDTLREIEQFLYRQSELLDSKLWQDYIDLFAADGVYWMPVTPEQTEWEGSPSIFAEDRYMMEVRMGRVTHPTAWSQVPMWSTSHLIGNVVIEAESGDECIVRSRFHMMELRRDTVRHFGGTYRHTLVRRDGQWKIKLQRVDMFNAQAPFEYVLQIWV